MASRYHTLEGGSRRAGFFFYVYSPKDEQIGSLRKLKSETVWRLELKLPSKRRILQMFPTFEESVRYLERVIEIVYQTSMH